MTHQILSAAVYTAAQDKAAVFTSISTRVAPQGGTACQGYSQAHHMPQTERLGLGQKLKTDTKCAGREGQ